MGRGGWMLCASPVPVWEGDGAPDPHSAPVAPHRAQSNACPVPVFHTGGARLPGPGPLTSRALPAPPLLAFLRLGTPVGDGDLPIYF